MLESILAQIGSAATDVARTGYENWQAILPAAAMATGGFVVMIVNLFMKRSEDADLAVFYCGLGGAMIALITSINQLTQPTMLAFADSIRIDGYAAFVGVIVASGTLLTILMSYSYHKRLKANLGDYITLVLFAASGMMLMAGANDLVTIFVGVELMSIPIYILVGQERGNERANEAAVKYLLLGGFASAFLLMGLAMLYGLFNEVALVSSAATQVATNAPTHGGPASTVLTSLMPLTIPGQDGSLPLAVLALGLILVGLGFKVGAVPFHQWVPDVYDGAPTAITGFMAVTVKAATFAVLLRILLVCFPSVGIDFQNDWNRGVAVDGDGIVQAVQPQSPAVKAGLQQGDQILEINGVSLAEKPFATAMQEITGWDAETSKLRNPDGRASIKYTRKVEGQDTRQEQSTTLRPPLSLGTFVSPILWLICLFSIVFGNLVALSQTSIKRMLAYSSIAHTGYLLLGVIAASGSTDPHDGWEVIFYLLVYTFMNLGAFAVIILAGRDDKDYDQIDQLSGLARKQPFAAMALLVAMLSMAGIPLTAGFVGKLGIFYTAIKNGFFVLSIIGILGSLIGLYYYLRVAYVIYMKPPASDDEFEDNPERFGLRFAVSVTAIATLLLGVFPFWIINAARSAVAALRSSVGN